MKNRIVFIISFLLFITIFILVSTNNTSYIDNIGKIVFVDNRSDFFNTFFGIFTYLGSSIVLVPIGILLLIFLKNKEVGFYSIVNLALVSLMNSIIKYIVSRPRIDLYNLVNESTYSFPSGHTASSFIFYFSLIYFSYKYFKNNRIRNIVVIILSMFITIVMISRVYLGAHYLSDVLGGLLLSICFSTVFVEIYKRIKKE